MSCISRCQERDDGAVAIVVAIMLVVFLAAVALAVDVGGLYLRRRELVNGADAAALSAARTCARMGHSNQDAFLPEEAGDTQVRLNSPITAEEVSPPNNVTYNPAVCGSQYGHLSAQYTSQQSLYFAPVLGFDHTSPVTTSADASWGLGSNSAVPTVLSNLFAPGTCNLPPAGKPSFDQKCIFWFDNEPLNKSKGNFTFLSLNAAGWDVPLDATCGGSGSGGKNALTNWINGTVPTSLVLNWTYPTYVCNDPGIAGVGGKQGPNSRVWSAMADLEGQVRDFPINWEGCGDPIVPCAPSGSEVVQGTVFSNGGIDKYDIVGFAAMQIDHVYGPNDQEIQGTDAKDWLCSGKVQSAIMANQTLSWAAFAQSLTGSCALPAIADSVKTVAINGLTSPGDYTYDTTGITIKTTIPKQTDVSFTLHTDAKPGACGDASQFISNNSAVCIITTWKGSTLTDDYPTDRLDDITIIRLCDLNENNCLDQRPR